MKLPVKIDPFILWLLGAMAFATVMPVSGRGVPVFEVLNIIGVAVLFFGHGVLLPGETVVAGIKQWKLHLFILATTFIVFPLLVLPMGLLPEFLLPTEFYLGFLYLAALPSTVSSSIAFTGIAKGNIPAAICAATASNVFGLLLTPFLFSFLASRTGPVPFSVMETLGEIFFQLLLPFGLGQLARPFIGAVAQRYKKIINTWDRGIVIMIAYTAFSHSVTAGLWEKTPIVSLVSLAVFSSILLGLVLLFTRKASRLMKYPVEDEIAAVFCGSKKSMASGLPMAKVLFGGTALFGSIMLPLIIFHQIQLVVCAYIARRYELSREADNK